MLRTSYVHLQEYYIVHAALYVMFFIHLCSLPGWRLCSISSTSSNLLNFNIFSTDFHQNPSISNFMKIRPVAAELFHADGRTDGWTDRRTDGRIDAQT